MLTHENAVIFDDICTLPSGKHRKLWSWDTYGLLWLNRGDNGKMMG